MHRLVLCNANLLDGLHPARPNMTVVLEDERIVSVVPDAEWRAGPPPGAQEQVVDLDGRTLMPGMVSGHFHAAYSMGGANKIPMGAPPMQLAYWALGNAQTALRAGYTSVVGAGTFHDIDARLAEALAAGVVPGPRFIPSSRALSPKVGRNESGEGSPWVKCWGPDEFRAAAIDEIERGAKVVKLFAAQGHAMRSCREMTLAELEAATRAAHDRGARTRAHVCGRAQVLNCIRAGVDIIDHADWMDDACVDAMLSHGSFVLPSMYSPMLAASDPNLDGASFHDQADFEYMRTMVPRANARGVRFVPGDDYGFFDMLPHGAYAGELACYVEAVGIPALDVIRWATAHGGAMTGIADLGTIEPGRLADVVVVDGDPAANIRVLGDPARIVAVLKGGQVQSGALPHAVGGAATHQAAG